MTEKKQDVRITKTKRSLGNALFSLLGSRSFSKITINDICAEAMVSRSTFYAHFEDKYVLLQFCLQEMEGRIFADYRNRPLGELLLMLLTNMQKDAKTLRNLMARELDVELLEMFRQQFIKIFKARLRELGVADEIDPAKVEVIASFYAGGVSQTIALWIEKRLPISTTEMADTLCELLSGLEEQGKPHVDDDGKRSETICTKQENTCDKG